MALKTNSHKARENVKQYILNNVDFTGYDIKIMTDANFPEIAHSILDIFRNEKRYERHRIGVEFVAFLDWTQGLPSVLDCCFWYNRSAVDDLGAILKKTEEEKAGYDEQEAGLLLVKLIYRELVNGESEYMKNR